MNGHKKHAKLTRPRGGQFHRFEYGIIGAPCSVIQQLSSRICETLAPSYKLAFVDADHQATTADPSPYSAVYTDKISFGRFDLIDQQKISERTIFNLHDGVIINGNHFNSAKQIVIINAKKRESLQRKLERLTAVELIILDEGEFEVHDFLINHLPDFHSIPVLSISNIEAIAQFMRSDFEDNEPAMIGLVLAGGKSMRMGEDKGKIQYRQQSQNEYLYNLLSTHCSQVFLSIRNEQSAPAAHQVMYDSFLGLGPYGAILSAFQRFPNNALLTLPCDAPFIDESLLANLVQHRNLQKVATCFHNPETQFPEPLITIWEPRAYPVLLQYLSMGYSCPRKVLINSPIEAIATQDNWKLFNANTQEERQWAIRQLDSK